MSLDAGHARDIRPIEGRSDRRMKMLEPRNNSVSAGAATWQREALSALVHAAMNGEEEAWESLYARFTGVLRRIAATYRLGEADISDVVQSTWSKCFEHLPSLRDPAALPGWLGT